MLFNSVLNWIETKKITYVCKNIIVAMGVTHTDNINRYY